MARSGCSAVLSIARSSSAVNISGPAAARALRIAFAGGFSNAVPKRIGVCISELSMPNLNSVRTRWISFPSATGPRVLARDSRNAAKSSTLRTSTKPGLPNVATTRAQLVVFRERPHSDLPPSMRRLRSVRNALHSPATVSPSRFLRAARPARSSSRLSGHLASALSPWGSSDTFPK